MKQSPSSEAPVAELLKNSPTFTQLKHLLPFYKSPTPVPILSQMNEFRFTPSHFFQAPINTVLPPRGIHFFGFLIKILRTFTFSRCLPHSSKSRTSLCTSLRLAVISSPFRLNILLNIHFSHILNFCSLLCRRPNVTPI